MPGKGTGELTLADLANVPEAGREAEFERSLARRPLGPRTVRYALTPQQRMKRRRLHAELRRKYGFRGLGESPGSSDWVTTINDMGDTYYALKPYLDFFADHPILSITIVLAVGWGIVGIGAWLGAGLKATGKE